MYGAFGALAAVLVGDLSVADEVAEGLVVDVVAADVLRAVVGEFLGGHVVEGDGLGVPAAVVGAQGHGNLCGLEFDAHRAVSG